MRILLLIILISISGIGLQAQTSFDSLFTVWQDQTQSDTTRLNAIDEIAWVGYLFSQPDSAFYFAQLQYDYAKKSGLKKQMAKALNTQAGSFWVRGHYPKSLEYHQRSLKIKEEIGDKKGIAASLNNIGVLYQRQGDHHKALYYFQGSLNVYEEIGNKQGIANSLGNLALTYSSQGDHPKSLEFQQRSLKIREEIGDKKGISTSLNNIGLNYQGQGDYPKALDYFQRSIKIKEEIGNKEGIAITLICMGILDQDMGDHQKAINKCSKGLLLAQEIGAVSVQRDACKCVYDSHRATGNGNDALDYHEQMLVLDESLNAKETAKRLQQMEFAKAVYADSVEKAEEARLIQEAHAEEVRQKNRTRNYLAGAGFLLLILSGGLYSRWRYVRKSKAVLQMEKDRSENLLLNILPADIAVELKEKGKADARDFEMVSILFTDFKGFTEASAKLNASELVAEINTCFEAFDGIIEKYGIEKIKTIGDAYMAAGGLPVPTDDSVKNTVLAALELQVFISKRKIDMDAAGKPAFEMRVGIHTGPVVAGIVGVKKFQYDIWGDSVNTAGRIESHGEASKVNISQATYELLKDDSQFAFESRGKIEAKGKGEIEMYFVSMA